MTKKIDSILDEVLKKITPLLEEEQRIAIALKDFKEKIETKIKKLNVDMQIFVGGSFAKKTLMKKEKYDIDVFLRYNKKYKEEEISLLTKRLIEDFPQVDLIHGSRDYFQIKISEDLFIEVVPVVKVRKPEESKNITDLSYSHVNYIRRKIKNKKILDEIKIAKAFCHANNCYGAESYINGFSGYSLELLVYYYGGFEKLVRALTKVKEKLVIDIEKHFKNKQRVLLDLNGSKLNSPIVLIDPTHKYRNALAALSQETFEKFQGVCKEFLKNPSLEFFEKQKTDLEKIKKDAEEKNQEFVLVEAKTDKQEGDVAGTKLYKFYKHLGDEISKYFEVKNKGFNYNDKKAARYFFVVKKKNELLIDGPLVKDEKNSLAFKKIHKVYFTKKGKLYAKEKIDFTIKEFLEKWSTKNKKRVKEMYVAGFEVL